MALGPALLLAAACCLGATAEGDILVYNQEPPRLIEEEFRDMPARFGLSLPPEGLRAFVVAGEPRDGCGPLKPSPPPPMPNFVSKWAVLVSRYNCSFEAKVRNAQSAGYDGVIVHNVNSSELESMSAKNSVGIEIPSVFIGEDAGIIIEQAYLYNNGYFVVINGDLPFNINTHLLLPFAILVGLFLILMIIFLTIKCMRERRRARRHRLPNSSLKKIPTCKFAKGDPYDTCAICLDDYVEGDKLRVLPCAHAYHCKCIDPWLTKNRRVCPICKRKVFASGERPVRSRGQESNSDSDTDDDRAPLVRGATNSTQGGTFQRQQENPFVRAAAEARGRSSSGRSSPRRQRSRGTSEPSEARAGGAGSWPESSGGARGGPFMTGVLNLQGERFTQPSRRGGDASDDTRRPPSASTVHRTREPRRFGRSSRRAAATSSEQDGPTEILVEERGLIGVAALPNNDLDQGNLTLDV